MREQRLAGEWMQDFRQCRLHAFSHAGSENDNVHRRPIEVMQNFITRPYGAFFAKATLFLLALLVAGCSAVRLGYANGDTIVYWWLDGYVDFNADQKSWVKADI